MSVLENVLLELVSLSLWVVTHEQFPRHGRTGLSGRSRVDGLSERNFQTIVNIRRSIIHGVFVPICYTDTSFLFLIKNRMEQSTTRYYNTE